MQPLERRLPNQQRDPATEPWLRSAAADMEINMIDINMAIKSMFLLFTNNDSENNRLTR